jgi:Ca2+-binding EF-hand superfamily protein
MAPAGGNPVAPEASPEALPPAAAAGDAGKRVAGGGEAEPASPAAAAAAPEGSLLARAQARLKSAALQAEGKLKVAAAKAEEQLGAKVSEAREAVAAEAPGLWARFKAGVASMVRTEGPPQTLVRLSECDLGAEELEELRMLTPFSDREIRILRVRFRQVAGDDEWIEPSELLLLPELAENPLRERLLRCFDTDDNGLLDFREFAIAMAYFSESSSREKKLTLAFRIHDYDGDDRISKSDLFSYLKDVTRYSMSAAEIAESAEREAEEAREVGDGASVEERVAYCRRQVAELTEEVKQAKQRQRSKMAKDAAAKKAEATRLATEVEKEAVAAAAKAATYHAAGKVGTLKAQNAAPQAKPAALKAPSAQETLAARISRYEERVRFLETETILHRVVDLTFAEASGDETYLTKDDFVRVIGHSDFQGKFTIDLTANVKVVA